MYSSNKLNKAVRLAIAFGAASAFAGAAVAQQAAQDVESSARVERIEVTGSRIKRTDLETASPVTVIDREAIEISGLLSIGDILQNIPAAGAALNRAFNNGGNGSTNIDLRNLGAQRLLVLVNGRRWISALNSTVDLNSIPSAAVERVEILKDGASSIYGSDAIAGVVNIITRKDFEGVEFSVYGGENASENDGRQYSAEATFGVTNARSGILFNMSHVTQHAIFAGDRDVSSVGFSPTASNTQFAVSANTLNAANQALMSSLYTPNAQGRYTLMSVEGTGPNVGIDKFRPVRGNNADNYNYAPDNYLATPQERNSFYVQGYYDITDDLRVVTDFVLTNRKSEQKLAPMPLNFGSLNGIAGSKVDIHADNIYNPFGETLYGNPARAAALGGYDPLTYSPYSVRRRLVEAGPRTYSQNVDTYRSMIGLEGSLSDTWTWDAAYIYGESNQTELTTGLLNLTRVNQALGANCNASTSCVPLNIFGGPGTITGDMLRYITFDSVSRGGLTLKDYTFNAAGDLFELPSGAVAMAFGFERREETGFDTPDPLTVTGESSGNQRDSTSGGFRLDEAYAELSIPVLENLLISPAIRYSDHSTFGSETTAKVGTEFRPIDDLLIRATWAQGYRAPSISQLFGGNADSFPGWTDPCNTVTAATPTAPARPIDISGLPGCAGVPQGYRQAASQIRITQVASADLAPETSTSKTFGFVYNPSWFEGFEFTADYYKIKVEDTIGRIGFTTIARTCADNTRPELCAFIDRDPLSGEITDLRNFLQNSGVLEVEGVDIFTAYRFPESTFGVFRATLDASYVIANEFNGADRVGLQSGDGGYPKWKAALSLRWMKDDWSANWSARYTHALQHYDAFYYDSTEADGITPRIPTYIIHDVSVGYNLAQWNSKLTLGINNLFAKEPKPEGINNNFAYSANNFSVAEYDVNMDRFVYLRATVRF